ncbi:MAG: CotH kinase family protein [Prevotella sp.]|nr:CotH kinase family protein [Prevotella sp.]
MKRLFTAAMLLAMTTITANAQDEQQYTHLVINELMQSNVECTMDDIHEFPDSWVELYNPTGATINLKDYKISNKNKDNNAWVLPNKEIPAGGYVVIYCDKEARTDKRLHTDFRLESGDGGKLYLFTGGVIVDKLEGMAKMPAPDVAYGRAEDGGETWGYQLTPSPGKTNTGIVPADHKILGAPKFSEPGRVGNTTVNLTLSLPDGAPEGAVIRYTTDGSEPTASSPSKTGGISRQYNGPITINKTTVIRAKVFCNGYLSPVSTAQSYIFHPRTMTVPIFSVQTDDLYLNGADSIGLFKYNTKKEDKKKCDWRRPVNIEMFNAEGEESIFNQLGETRIQGGQSRGNALRSMVFYANKRFDPVNKRFSWEFFPDQRPDITEFKSFSLRDGGNDFTDLYFRDLIIQRTMGENTDIDWQAGHTAVLYINGEYMGMLNIRERSNADNIYSNYGGLEDIDMIEIGHEQVKKNNIVIKDLFIEELKEGTDNFYKDFQTFYSNPVLNHTLAEYEQWLDVSEYLNVAVMNLFYGNIDWPGNNTVFWRPNDNDKKSGLPKRFRVIAKDVDFGLGLYGRTPDYNTIDLLYTPSNYPNDNWAYTDSATCLIKNMLKDPDILNLFIDKSCVYMGDFMNASGTSEVIDKIQAEAMEEFVAHRNKYNSGHDNRTDINTKFENAKKWLTGYTEYDRWGRPTTYQSRTNYFYDFIRQKWNLGTAIPVTINNAVDDAELPDEVLVNNIKLTKGVFDGKLFLDRLITIEAKNNIENDYSVTGWEIKKNGVSEEPVEGTTYNFTVPSCSKLEINAVKVHKPQVTISEYGAVSFSSTKPLDFTNMPDLKAYIVTEQNGNKFIKEQVYKVPANTGLVIEGAKGTYKIPVASANTSFDTVSNNLLRPTSTGAFTVPDDGNVYYGLFYSNIRQTVGFQQKVHPYTFDVNKSYLCLTQQQLGKEMPEIFFGETISGVATNIQGVNNNTWTEGQIYNLNGQRVDKNYNGVIIVNGKKVVNNRK